MAGEGDDSNVGVGSPETITLVFCSVIVGSKCTFGGAGDGAGMGLITVTVTESSAILLRQGSVAISI